MKDRKNGVLISDLRLARCAYAKKSATSAMNAAVVMVNAKQQNSSALILNGQSQ